MIKVIFKISKFCQICHVMGLSFLNGCFVMALREISLHCIIQEIPSQPLYRFILTLTLSPVESGFLYIGKHDWVVLLECNMIATDRQVDRQTHTHNEVRWTFLFYVLRNNGAGRQVSELIFRKISWKKCQATFQILIPIVQFWHF